MESGWVRRWLEVTAFVAIWVAAGEILDMGVYAYLLFGIPLTAAFQLFVRRRPIRDLWVRGGPALSTTTVNPKQAIPLALVPLYHLISGVISGEVGPALYAIAAIVGAAAAAYALGRFVRRTWLYLGLCVSTAGLIGILIFADAAWHAATAVHPTGVHLRPSVLAGVDSLLLLVPAVFMVEEVAFRGALDSHVRHPGQGGGATATAYGIASAIFISVLWGLWHHPIIPGPVWKLLVLQVAVGPFLSLFWRRSGNLLVPGFAHALIDSVRNALGMTP